MRRRLWSVSVGIVLSLLFFMVAPLHLVMAQSPDTYDVSFEEIGYRDEVLYGPQDSTSYYFSLPASWAITDGTYLTLEIEYQALLASGEEAGSRSGSDGGRGRGGEADTRRPDPFLSCGQAAPGGRRRPGGRSGSAAPLDSGRRLGQQRLLRAGDAPRPFEGGRDVREPEPLRLSGADRDGADDERLRVRR